MFGFRADFGSSLLLATGASVELNIQPVWAKRVFFCVGHSGRGPCRPRTSRRRRRRPEKPPLRFFGEACRVEAGNSPRSAQTKKDPLRPDHPHSPNYSLRVKMKLVKCLAKCAMQNFDFQNPTRIVFGADRLDDLQRLIPANAKVLMVYGGGSIKKNGVYQKITAQLKNRDCAEFGGVEPNPSLEQLEPVIALAKEKKIDFILAVGGGSVIDASKFVAAAAKYEGDPWDILASRGKKVKSAIPVGVFLTLPATGSESNVHSVITRKQWKVKATFSSSHVSPKFAMLDPSVMASLPARQLGNGVVDAFVHVMEQYLTVPANAPVQDRFAEGLLQTLVEIGPQVVANPADLQTSGNLMWTACMALNGLIGVGVPQDWSTHAIGHELTALYNLDHAQTLAIVLPAMMHVRRAAKQQKLLQYARRVWGLVPASEADEDLQACITAAIERTRAFFESVGVKTKLADYQLQANVVPVVVKQLEAHGITEMGEDQGVTLETVRQVLQHAL